MKREATSLQDPKSNQTSDWEGADETSPAEHISRKRKSSDAERARLRRNQRASRARRAAYVSQLETQWSQYVRLGARATAEMQVETRRVCAENMILRTMLRERGCDNKSIDDTVKFAMAQSMPQHLEASPFKSHVSPHESIPPAVGILGSHVCPRSGADYAEASLSSVARNEEPEFTFQMSDALDSDMGFFGNNVAETSAMGSSDSPLDIHGTHTAFEHLDDLQRNIGSWASDTTFSVDTDPKSGGLEKIAWANLDGQPVVGTNPEPANLNVDILDDACWNDNWFQLL